MTDKYLKEMLKNAYALPTTEHEYSFIRRNEKRSLRLFDVMKLEFRYMGLSCILAGVVLCLLCLVAVKINDVDKMWFFSSLIPICAVIPLIFLSRSERCGMAEMEASCRFSLRYIRLVRMCIIGMFALVLLSTIGSIMKALCAVAIIDYIACVITPYLVSDFGAMLVTRRWHGKENIYGILAVCIASSLVPFAVKQFRQSGFLTDTAIVVIAVALLIAVIRESVMYVKESEIISWNLC